jgi:hypothetical protein
VAERARAVGLSDDEARPARRHIVLFEVATLDLPAEVVAATVIVDELPALHAKIVEIAH